MSLNILFENRDIFVIDKPAGLLSVPGRSEDKYDSAETRARGLCAGAAAVHRLDMATSGVLLIAKHKDAERFYKRAFENRDTAKIYRAIVHGCPAPPNGRIALPLRCDWPNRPRQIVCHEHGKPACTDYALDAGLNAAVLIAADSRWTALSGKSLSRLTLTPITGRSHQLRVHLASIGCPIVGDNLYAPPDDCLLPRLLLHAESLTVPMPDGSRQTFLSPVPF